MDIEEADARWERAEVEETGQELLGTDPRPDTATEAEEAMSVTLQPEKQQKEDDQTAREASEPPPVAP
ncbi:hypothetical protein VP06_14540 [Methylobacterium aquaticum]|uniref:Uncharacterized protein n=1 Tax=Methylobacterium aquaticum TaxID=270351 RepID=A0A0J6SLI9_9HYPH|nr:hypothetical protein VP06_14540 [Methylobacterium aquaticum]